MSLSISDTTGNRFSANCDNVIVIDLPCSKLKSILHSKPTSTRCRLPGASWTGAINATQIARHTTKSRENEDKCDHRSHYRTSQRLARQRSVVITTTYKQTHMSKNATFKKTVFCRFTWTYWLDRARIRFRSAPILRSLCRSDKTCKVNHTAQKNKRIVFSRFIFYCKSIERRA